MTIVTITTDDLRVYEVSVGQPYRRASWAWGVDRRILHGMIACKASSSLTKTLPRTERAAFVQAMDALFDVIAKDAGPDARPLAAAGTREGTGE